MVIKNSTPWRTEDLRKLFRRCIREVERVEQPSKSFHQINKYYRWDILNGNHRWGFWGRASLNGYWMMIKIGTRQSSNEEYGDEMPLENKKQLARTIIHEYYHNLGFKNQDRNNYRSDFTKEWNVDWVSEYPIRKKEIAKQESVDIKFQRYQRAIENLRRAETRLKRAKTLYKKWLNKVKYYSKTYNKNS
jgi:hypothetical protein